MTHDHYDDYHDYHDHYDHHDECLIIMIKRSLNDSR